MITQLTTHEDHSMVMLPLMKTCILIVSRRCHMTKTFRNCYTNYGEARGIYNSRG